MPFTAPQPRKKGFDAGVYEAVCYCVLDLGVQEDKFGTAHKMLIGWKMLDYTYEDGNYVSYHQLFERRFEGINEIVDPLEWDVKAYFLLW